MRYWTWILLASFLAAAPGSAQCTRFLSLVSSTGLGMSGLGVRPVNHAG